MEPDEERADPLPLDVGEYTLYSCIGQAMGRTASVYLAMGNDDKKKVCAVRVCCLESEGCDFSLLMTEIAAMRTLRHPNILPLQDVLVKDSRLLLVTPLMDYGSVRDLLLYRFTFGLAEQHVAAILRDVLKGLEYMHERGWMHRTIRCSHILISSSGHACLSGLRLAASVMREDRRLRALHHFGAAFKSSILWLAPEVLQQSPVGYDLKSDIYSIGITACEMANGFPPFADMASLKMFVEKLRGITPRLLDGKTLLGDGENTESTDGSADEHKNRWFSDKFHAFVDCCLKLDPKERPSVFQLSKHPFFKQYKRDRLSVIAFLQDVKPMTPPEERDDIVPSTLDTIAAQKTKSPWLFS